MPMTSEAETLARKIDETRTDVRTLHPLMQLLNTEETNPAQEFAERMIGLLKQICEEQMLLRQGMTKMEELIPANQPSPVNPKNLEIRMQALDDILLPLPNLLGNVLKSQTDMMTRIEQIEKTLATLDRIFGQTLD